MKKKQRRTKKHQSQHIFSMVSSLELLFGISIVLLILLSFSHLLFRPGKAPVIKKEMTEIPKNVQKEIDKKIITARYRIPILMYHYVEYVKDKRDTIRQSLDIPPAVFASQLQTLTQNGYTFLTASEVADIIDGKKTLPEKPIVLTFDDGYRDFYTDVLPIIKKYNVKVVAYIVPGFNNLPNNMDAWQIDSLEQSGLVEIGAHTVHHAYLKGMSDEKALYEIATSKEMLENQLHIPIVSFAYPYGAFDQHTIDLVKEAGFTSAVSTIPGIEVSDVNRYFLFRLRPGDRTGKGLLAFLEQSNYKSF